MKKLILLFAITLGLVSQQANAQWSVIATNLTATPTKVNLLAVGRYNIKQVHIGASTAGQVELEIFNNSSVADPVWGTNYVTSAYTNVLSYTTNFVSTYVNYNGITNYATNSGIYTYLNNVAAATNGIAPSAKYVVQGNTAVIFDANILNERGIVLRCNTNASVVIYYTQY